MCFVERKAFDYINKFYEVTNLKIFLEDLPPKTPLWRLRALLYCVCSFVLSLPPNFLAPFNEFGGVGPEILQTLYFLAT